MDKKTYPCDYGECPYDAQYGCDCYHYCGLGCDDNDIQYEEEDM